MQSLKLTPFLLAHLQPGARCCKELCNQEPTLHKPRSPPCRPLPSPDESGAATKPERSFALDACALGPSLPHPSSRRTARRRRQRPAPFPEERRRLRPASCLLTCPSGAGSPPSGGVVPAGCERERHRAEVRPAPPGRRGIIMGWGVSETGNRAGRGSSASPLPPPSKILGQLDFYLQGACAVFSLGGGA